MHLIIDNKLTIGKVAYYVAYMLGHIDQICKSDPLYNAIHTVGIKYDYATNSLVTYWQGYGLYECKETETMVMYDRADYIGSQVKQITARIYGCYVANDRAASANEAPTMIVDYRNDRV